MAAERLSVLLLALLVVAPAAAAQQDESGGGDLSPGAFREAVGGCPNITESRVSTTVDRCAAADDLCGLECAGEIAYYTFLAIDQPLPCELFTVDQARFVDLVNNFITVCTARTFAQPLVSAGVNLTELSQCSGASLGIDQDLLDTACPKLNRLLYGGKEKKRTGTRIGLGGGDY